MEVIESAKCISDLPELEGDTSHLRWYTEHHHESDTDSTHTSGREAPEVCCEESNDEYKKCNE